MDIMPTLLPRELKLPNVSETTMIELTTQVPVSEGKYLNINSHLSQEKQLSLTNLLKNHKHAISWSYHDMKSLHPKLCNLGSISEIIVH